MKNTSSPKRTSRPADDWDERWKRYWNHGGVPAYELPVPGPLGEERDFLTHTRTPQKEKQRLKRITSEFDRAFKALHAVGPAVTVFGSARFKENHRYYKLARAVGAELARTGFATLTGGGPGIMEAANRGAHEAGGASHGLNIILPHEQAANPYVDSSTEFYYFFSRKVCLVKYSCAFIVMPGGLGTLDELFEAATLIQCRKIGPFPLVLMGTEFWDGLRKWGRAMMKEGVFNQAEIAFGTMTDSPAEAVDLIIRGLPPSVREHLRPAPKRGRTKPKPGKN